MTFSSLAGLIDPARSPDAGQTALERTPESSGADLGKPFQISERTVRITFWSFGFLLAVLQSWSNRHYVTADAIQYLDMSDGVSPISNWHRLINGIWSPLYAVLLGLSHVFRPNPYQEIVTAHFLNVGILLFTFGCFEFFLRTLMPAERGSESSSRTSLPRWAFLAIGYSIFLWVCIAQITFESLRPDLLMAGFAYLSMGLVVRIKRNASWGNFLALGLVLGVAYLSKAPMLAIGMVMLACTLTQWRQTLAKAVAAGILLLSIGSLYYVPLSRQLNHFSFGESSSYNYLFHVNQASPTWYLSDPGSGVGEFRRSPSKIYNSPPAYEFHYPQTVTHALRFDPVYWTLGVKPRFTASGQFWAIVENSKVYAEMLGDSGGMTVALVLLFLISGPMLWAAKDVTRYWPVVVVGLFGLGMYLLVHLENRYAGVFFSLVWLGLLAGMKVRRDLGNRLVPAITLGIALAMLGPMTVQVVDKFIDSVHKNFPDPDVEVATQLHRLGLAPGSPVARISFQVIDLGWARMSRSSIVAEVDYERADEYWTAGEKIQQEVLDAFAKTGAKAVVAHTRGGTAPPGWQRLGRTRYWIHWLA